jgi:Tfp pilus assembly PilM family ATPase
MALPHAAAGRLIDTLECAGLRVVAIDLGTVAAAECAALNQSRDTEQDSPTNVAPAGPSIQIGIDLGWRCSTLTCVLGATLMYERRVDGASLKLCHAGLVRSGELSAEAADAVLQMEGIEGWPPASVGAMAVIAREMAMEILGECDACVEFIGSRAGEPDRVTCHLIGGGAHVRSLRDALTRTIQDRGWICAPGSADAILAAARAMAYRASIPHVAKEAA